MLPVLWLLVSSFVVLLKLLHRLKLGTSALPCWVFLRANDLFPGCLLTMLRSWQSFVITVGSSTLFVFLVKASSVKSEVRDNVMLSSFLRGVGESVTGLSLSTSTNTSRSSSSMIPICYRIEVEHPSFVRTESTSPLLGCLKVGVGDMFSPPSSIMLARIAMTFAPTSHRILNK